MIISLLLLLVVVLSASATFAADDVAADDGITDDVLTTDVSDDSDVLNDPPVVTKDNFNDYFDNTGNLNSDAEELVFEGDFSGLDVSAITIARETPVKFTGNNATFKNVQFMIMQNGVTIEGFNFVTNESNPHSKLIYIIGEGEAVSGIILANNNIQFIAPKGEDGYAIFAGAEEVMGSYEVYGLQIIDNNITYVGTTDGTTVNNVIRVNGDAEGQEQSSDILVQGNSFDIQMPSINVQYDPDTWESKTMSEGIAFVYCDNVRVINNKIKMKYNNNGQSYDSLYVISAYSAGYGAYKSSEILIKDNVINATGYNYIYGIRVSADEFDIYNNTLLMSADKTQATGINIDGPSTEGEVYNNTIKLSAPVNAYGIYAWENMMTKDIVEDVEYYDNVIYLDSYLACGLEINQPDQVIRDNNITAFGNFTYGIAASIKPGTSYAQISNNIIICGGNNIGFGSGDPILKTGSAGISTLGSALIQDNKIASSCVGVTCVGEAGINSIVQLQNNIIYVIATGNKDNYGVKVTETTNFAMSDNNITFIGKTNGTIITNGVYIFDTPASVAENNFNFVIPAADIVYGPAPAYEETIVAEGIVVDYVDDFEFTQNNVTVTYGDIIGYYDTIRAIDISNSDDVQVYGNKINAKGNQYIYAIKVTGKGFVIYGNEINATSNYYANGINIESPSTGGIVENIINVKAPNSAYPIYAGMNGQNLTISVVENNISGEAYYVVGVEVGGDRVAVYMNDINVKGNHTIGIGAYVNELYVLYNDINSIASNEGNVAIWDNMGTDTTGIKVVKGNFTIDNNEIYTTGDYAAILDDNSGNITNNDLLSNLGAGNDAIIGLGNVNATGNPATANRFLKVVLIAEDLTKVEGSADQFKVKILDENGKPIENKTIKLIIDGKTYTKVSGADGSVAFDINLAKGTYFATTKFDGDAEYGYKSITNDIVVNAKPAPAPTKKATTITAKKKTFKVKTKVKKYAITLKSGKTAVKKVQVTLKVKGKTYSYL